VQVSEQRFCFLGCRQVQSFAHAPFAIELAYYQVGISMDRHPSRWTVTQVFQDVEYSCVFRHVIGHGTALTDQAMLFQEDNAVTISDHHPECGGPSRVNRLASSIKPSKVIVHVKSPCLYHIITLRDLSIAQYRQLTTCGSGG
jgi:hypothetical protein